MSCPAKEEGLRSAAFEIRRPDPANGVYSRDTPDEGELRSHYRGRKSCGCGALLGIPVFAIGEACCHGILNPSNIAAAIASNFGDILPTSDRYRLDVLRVVHELSDCVDGKRPKNGRLADVLSAFRIERVAAAIMQVYRRAMVQKVCPGSIPVLMYHRVPDAPPSTRHQTYVTRKNFRKHLRFFRLRGLTSITFKDYADYVSGRRDWRAFPRKAFHPYF